MKNPGEHIATPEELIDDLYSDETGGITENVLRLLGLEHEDYGNLLTIRDRINAPTEVKTLQRILRFVRFALDADPDLRSKI